MRCRFDLRYRALLGGTRTDPEHAGRDGFAFLPAGWHLELDRVASEVVLNSLLGDRRGGRADPDVHADRAERAAYSSHVTLCPHTAKARRTRRRRQRLVPHDDRTPTTGRTRVTLGQYFRAVSGTHPGQNNVPGHHT